LRISVLALAIVLGTGAAGTLSAQTRSGRLFNVNTEEPLESGVVSLLDSTGVEVASSITNPTGWFQLVAPRPGTYLVKARRLGYRQWIDGPLEIHEGDALNAAFHLKPDPVTLSSLSVTAEASAQFLRNIGFYQRQRSDFGHYVTRDQIDMRRPQRMTDLLVSVPGVKIVPAASGAGRTQVQLRGSRPSDGGPCDPRVFIDGFIAVRGGSTAITVDGTNPEGVLGDPSSTDVNDPGPTLDDLVSPREIEAMEIYRSSSQIPARFGGAGAATRCGVIVVWTRRGW
jgi:Carboxypeptidase regulatory-like domain/TonB-dependent Receptor Plug Domain